MQPQHLKIALMVSDEQHAWLVQAECLPLTTELQVLPGGAATPLWDALLHLPRSGGTLLSECQSTMVLSTAIATPFSP